jgi:hypothetical protein
VSREVNISDMYLLSKRTLLHGVLASWELWSVDLKYFNTDGSYSKDNAVHIST